MSTVRDHLWIWGHEAGSHNDRYGLAGSSRMAPAEGAFYLDVPNIIMVRYNDKPAPPFDQHARALSPLKRVVWSIVGAGKPMPVSSMEHQCRMGLRWLREGRIEGMIFLANCICDLELEAVEWTRNWIREIGEENV